MSGRLIPEFDGSCWAHVARLFERIPDGLLTAYVAEIWLDQRGGNDSFRGSGIVKRYALAIDGFGRMADHFFGRSSVEAFHVRRVLRFEFTLRMFLDAKLLCAEYPAKEDMRLLDRLVDATYADPSLRLAVCKLLYQLTPLWALRCARFLFGRSRRRTPA
jgi:abequosyltransferase